MTDMNAYCIHMQIHLIISTSENVTSFKSSHTEGLSEDLL